MSDWKWKFQEKHIILLNLQGFDGHIKASSDCIILLTWIVLTFSMCVVLTMPVFQHTYKVKASQVELLYWYNLVFTSHVMHTLEEKRLTGTSHVTWHEELVVSVQYCRTICTYSGPVAQESKNCSNVCMFLKDSIVTAWLLKTKSSWLYNPGYSNQNQLFGKPNKMATHWSSFLSLHGPSSVPKLRDVGSNWADYEPRVRKAMGYKGLWRHMEELQLHWSHTSLQIEYQSYPTEKPRLQKNK